MTTRDVLSKRVEQILPSRQALETLMKKKKIRLYWGVDPTAPQLHLGHAVVLRKLREFQELGHEVVLLFGTFTAQIGDPSGKDKAREPLSGTVIKNNMATYKKQAGKILDLSKTTIKKNGDWLSRLKPEEFLHISSFFTSAQLLERDMFQKRVQKGQEVWINELLYPLLQGYDSVAMDVDAEIGGTDQTFNMLIGRRLQRVYRKKEKFVLTVPLLLGLDGRKMSKSYGNAVNMLDNPQEMYGKLMSMRDELIPQYVELCTEMPAKEFAGLPPMQAKALLAKEIVAAYRGQSAAAKAEKEFARVFREKKAPLRMPGVNIEKKTMPLAELLVRTGLAASKAEARRLVAQGGVSIDKARQNKAAADREVPIASGMIVQVGPRRFVKIR